MATLREWINRFRWLEDLADDLRYGLRSFRRSPGFALTAVLSLALGIGANAAIFNALYTVLLEAPAGFEARRISYALVLQSAGGCPAASCVRCANSGARAIFEGVSVMSADGLSFSYDDRAERVHG